MTSTQPEPRVITFAGLVAALALRAGAARASSTALFIDVHREHAALSCPDAQAIWQRIDELFPNHRIRQTAEADAAGLSVAITVHTQPEGYEATLRIPSEPLLERRITDRDPRCGGLGEALAVAVVLLLEPEAKARPRRAINTRDAAPSTSARELTLTAQGSGVAGLGLLGRADYPSFGPSLTLTVESGGPTVRARGMRLFSPQRDVQSGTIQVDAWAAMFGPCFRLTLGRVTLLPCAELGLGSQRGQARGFSDSDAARRPWRVLAAEIAARTEIAPPLWVEWSLTGVLRLHDQSFLINAIPASRQAPFSGFFGLGLGASWEILQGGDRETP